MHSGRFGQAMDMHAPYDPPGVRVADPPSCPRQLTRGEKTLLVLLLINAAIGGFSIVGGFVVSGAEPSLLALVPLLLPTLGFVAAALMFRYPIIGLGLGIAFYLFQTISYFGPEGIWGFHSGLYLNFSVSLGSGALVVNAFAMVLSFAHIFAVARCYGRLRKGKVEAVI